MGAPVVQIDGLRELRAQLRKSGADMADMKEAHAGIAGVILPLARSGAPVSAADGKHLFTTVRSSATKTQAVIRAGNNTTVRYANPIHWGWMRRHIRPNPWASRAAQSSEPTWFALYVKNIESIIDKIKGIAP